MAVVDDDGLYVVVEGEKEGGGGKLLLGTQRAALDRELLWRHGVARIVCLGTPAFHEGEGKFSYLAMVNLKDLPSENLLGRLDECMAFIGSGMRRGESVLVNCVYAQSRSAAVAVAYLMRTGLSLSQATSKVREAQPTVHINPGFEAQLQLYYNLGCILPGTSAGKIEYTSPSSSTKGGGEGAEPPASTRTATQAAATYRWFLFAKGMEEHGRWIAPAGAETGSQRGSTYRCKACRTPLFRDSNVVDHTHAIVLVMSDSVYASFSRHGDGSSWLKARDAATAASFSTKTTDGGAKGRLQACYANNSRVFLQRSGSEGVAPANGRCNSCTSVFTEALGWIDIAKSRSAKITCPGQKGTVACGSKLGAWNAGGINCSCGRMVKPAIQFTLRRIERLQAF